MVTLRHGFFFREGNSVPKRSYFAQLDILGGGRVEWDLWSVNDDQFVVTQDRRPVFSGTVDRAESYVLTTCAEHIEGVKQAINCYASEGVRIVDVSR